MVADIQSAFLTYDSRPSPGFLAACRRLVARLSAIGAFARQSIGIAPMLQSRHADSAVGLAPPISRDLMLRFQNTVVPHLDAAYNFARFLSRDADAAQDIVQDAFLRAYRSFDSYRGGEPRAWMFAIVRNCYYACMNDVRRKSRFETPMAMNEAMDADQPLAAYEIASDEDTPEAAMIRKMESQRVRQVINSLPDISREVLVLRELESLSYRQIADITEVPIGTVMSRLARARREFGDVWQAGERNGAQS
jgi:RNA polymerase sigma-70 factor (ECF subfamily)